MKVKKMRYSPKYKQSGTCRVMSELSKHIESIERTHKIQLNDKEKDRLRSMFCGYICNGNCRTLYTNLPQ